MKKIIIVIISMICTSGMLNAQSLPKGFKEKIKKEYNSFSEEEKQNELKMDFAKYLEFRKSEYLAGQNNKSQTKSSSNLCDNGTFENGDINISDWGFEWGGGHSSSGYTNGTTRLNSGYFTGNGYPPNEQVHHQVQSVGTDPNAPIQKVWSYPVGNTKSLRLGNAHNYLGKESISKNGVLVTNANTTFNFSYAVVLNDPAGHTNAKPYFAVFIEDAITGTDYSGLVNLGGGTNILASNHPLLINSGNNMYSAPIMYKDWECITVDLSSLVGKSINIKFETRDCWAGAHMGYAYLDNICIACDGSPSQEGSIELNQGQTDTCGIPGKICVDYTLPTGNNPSVEIDLELIQNGSVVNTISSGSLTSGSSHCFNLTSVNTSGLNNSLNGFDIKFIGKPKLGTFALTNKIIGNSQIGIKSGSNNDYITNCPKPKECCTNTIKVWGGTDRSEYRNAGGKLNSGFTIGYEDFLVQAPSSALITEIKAVVTNVEYISSYGDCQDCHTLPIYQGSIHTNGNIGSNPSLKPVQNAWFNQPDPEYSNLREATWTSQGTKLVKGDKVGFVYIMPALSDIPCCADSMRVCISIRYKDANCDDCEVVRNTCTTLPLRSKPSGNTPKPRSSSKGLRQSIPFLEK